MASAGNNQLFALRQPPPAELTLARATYRLVKVFKHDFYAATCLYESSGAREPATLPLPLQGEVGPKAREGASPEPSPGPSGRPLPEGEESIVRPRDCPRVVVKFYRQQDFCGLPAAWIGRFSRDHERAIYRALAGVSGVPRYVGDVGATGLAIEYVDARPADHLDALPPGWFDSLRAVLDQVHARGVAYVDANKLSNLLVAGDGQPWLIDFQIALRRRDDWPWPLRPLAARVVAAMQQKDLYHLYKHKRRLARHELRAEEEELSHPRGPLHRLHRWLTKPYRALRRRFLREQYQAGRLVSPTAELENHHQPEKETWRK